MEKILNSNRKLYLLLTLWSAVVLMLMSPDSPIHGPWGHCDSAIFFMSGKALMNGLRPYVEFTDSKGPLLWLFYGVGYLLSPRSYTGVYVVSVFVYAGVFYYNYKTARIFLKDENRSLAVTLLMTFAYFLFWFHFEIRAEDFSTLPVAVSLYYMCRMIYGSGDAAAQPTIRHQGLVQGGCFMALLLIKFSIAAMQGIIILIVLWYLARERKEYFKPVGWMAAGAIAMALPFLIYLWLRGAVPAFIEEYFINTYQTLYTITPYTRAEDMKSFYDDILVAWATPQSLAFFLFIIYGGWMLGRQQQSYRYALVLVGVFFFGVATRHNLGYYYGICHIFIIFLLIWILSLVAQPFKIRFFAVIVAVFAAWGIYVNVDEEHQMQRVSVWAQNEDREHYESIAGVMMGSSKPRILNLYYWDKGFGLYQEALPAGRYWTHQLGATPKMDKQHDLLMELKQADYVIVYDEMSASLFGCPPGKILSCGYTRCLRTTHVINNKKPVCSAVYKRKR